MFGIAAMERSSLRGSPGLIDGLEFHVRAHLVVTIVGRITQRAAVGGFDANESTDGVRVTGAGDSVEDGRGCDGPHIGAFA